MERKITKVLVLLVVFLLLALGAVIVGKNVLQFKNNPGDLRSLLEEKNKELDAKERQIQSLDNQIARLRKELEDSSRQIAELKARPEKRAKVPSSVEQRQKGPVREMERPAVTAAQPGEKPAPKPAEVPSIPIPRRPAEPGTYEVIQTTAVFEQPSRSSRRVATISKGTRVLVVGSIGEWLEVRSKHDNPPGFINRDDAMFIEKRN